MSLSVAARNAGTLALLLTALGCDDASMLVSESNTVVEALDDVTARPAPAAFNDCEFVEDFEGLEDGAPWPEPWVDTGGVAMATVRSGWGRLEPQLTDYSLARMLLPLQCQNVDVRFTFMFSHDSSQAAAVYGRHNGGYLDATTPSGRGLAVAAENFRNPSGLGAWRELGGTEQDITVVPTPMLAETPYRMRMKIVQLHDTLTRVWGKVWLAEDPEPSAWTFVEYDQTPSLQQTAGGVALDAYSGLADPAEGAIAVYFDDISITEAVQVTPPPPQLMAPSTDE